MNLKSYLIHLDIKRGILNPQNLQFTTEDNGTCELQFKLLADKITSYDLTNCVVRLMSKTPNRPSNQQECVITSVSEGIVSVILLQGMFEVEGDYLAELQIYNSTDQTLRLTAPRFTYRVVRSLMDDNTAAADPNFSILQDMIINVTNADETATTALIKANEAVTTANQAVTTINNQVTKVNQAVEDANEALERAGDVATQEELDAKITLGDVPQTNFNFIGRKVEQDGLLKVKVIDTKLNHDAGIKFSNEKYFTVSSQIIYTKTTPTAATSFLFGQGSNVSGFYVVVDGTGAVVLYLGNGTAQKSHIATKKIDSGLHNITLTRSDNNYKLTIDGENFINEYYDGMIYYDFANIGINGYRGGMGSSEHPTTFYFIYNRILTLQEISHNIQVLNNTESIDSLSITDKNGANKNFILATGSYHTTMANGYNVEQAYTGLLKTMGKEFISTDGSPIEINNGVEYGKVISGEIQGNTIKNIQKYKQNQGAIRPESGFTKDSASNILGYTKFIKNTSATISSSFVIDGNFNLESNKQYYLSIFCLSNKKSIPINPQDFIITTIPEARVLLKGKTFLTTDGSANVFDFITPSNLTTSNGVIHVYIKSSDTDFAVDDWIAIRYIVTENAPSYGIVPFGLSSTSATITNNGQSYPIYHPTELNEDGSKKLISLGGINNTNSILKLEQDGSVTLTNKIITHTITSNDTLAKYKESLDGAYIYIACTAPVPPKLNTLGMSVYGYVGEDKYQMYYQNCVTRTIWVLGSGLCVSIAKADLPTPDVTGFRKWLETNPIQVSYQAEIPITTYVPKEITPTIPTNKINNLSVGDGVNASSFNIIAPVDRIQELLTRMAAQEAKTNTMAVNVPYVEETYANSKNKIEEVMLCTK